MSGDSSEDDYLSEKFLVNAEAPATKPQTYAERRRAAQRQAEIKQERNRKVGRRELEEETRKEGLSTSLFTRAQEDGENKAMSMMMKMGFKIGQSLGRIDDETPTAGSGDAVTGSEAPQHRVEPLPVGMWQGRKGVGLGKRAASPGAAGRQAKAARLEDARQNDDFRGRARSDWEDRRAEGRLATARRTCVSLDERAGKDFNVFWLDAADPGSFPPGLVDALQADADLDHVLATDAHRVADDEETLTTAIPTAALALRLQREMRQYALSAPDADPDADIDTALTTFSPETLEQARAFLVMPPVARLDALLAYLRRTHSYCFWCGAEYDDAADLEQHCPGPDEAAHD